MKRRGRRDVKCQVPRCRRPVELVYLGRGCCDHHWRELAGDRRQLCDALGISPAEYRLGSALDYAEQLAHDRGAA